MPVCLLLRIYWDLRCQPGNLCCWYSDLWCLLGYVVAQILGQKVLQDHFDDQHGRKRCPLPDFVRGNFAYSIF